MKTRKSTKTLAERIRGRRIEDISRRDLALAAAETGFEASQAALAAGQSITKFIEGKLFWLHPDGSLSEDLEE